jgi:DNA helicase-2/ATP-dependent DNA helicase PcrA
VAKKKPTKTPDRKKLAKQVRETQRELFPPKAPAKPKAPKLDPVQAAILSSIKREERDKKLLVGVCPLCNQSLVGLETTLHQGKAAHYICVTKELNRLEGREEPELPAVTLTPYVKPSGGFGAIVSARPLTEAEREEARQKAVTKPATPPAKPTVCSGPKPIRRAAPAHGGASESEAFPATVPFTLTGGGSKAPPRPIRKAPPSIVPMTNEIVEASKIRDLRKAPPGSIPNRLGSALGVPSSPAPLIGSNPPIGYEPGVTGALASLRRQFGNPETDTAPHLIIIARAGTGKTTTLIEGVKQLRGIPSELTPSPQQAAVWESIKLSLSCCNSICMAAFNKGIATRLQELMPPGCQASTLHSLGFRSLGRAFGGKLNMEEYRVANLIAELLERPLKEIRNRDPILLSATDQLVALCKQNLVGGFGDFLDVDWVNELWELADHYEVELEGYAPTVFKLVPQVLSRCASDFNSDRKLDYNDMIWLPLVLDVPIFRNDVLLVDEAQDLNRAQQQLALKAGRRLILCGDPKQAIYGFAGADADSIPRMTRLLGETSRGVTTLPLTVTRRCGHAIVEEARKLVPDFEAWHTNPAGKITYAKFDGPTKCTECKGFGHTYDVECEACSGRGVVRIKTEGGGYRSGVKYGDFVVCRTSAPLISQCMRFLSEGKKAKVQGRNVGEGLLKLIDKLDASTVAELIESLHAWYDREVEKVNAHKNPSEAKLIALEDRRDCILLFCEEAKSVAEVIGKISKIFTDEEGEGVRLSTIHRVKGLEAKRVFFLQPPGAGVPHPAARSSWQIAQEYNLKYVAITRAIEELIYVS